MLGFGTAASWTAKISNNTFIGSKSVASYGAAVPLSGGHWAEGTKSGGVEASLDPTLAFGKRKNFTALDFAGLDDIGWDVVTPPASIAGTLFNDLDSDGVKDTGEGSLSGWRVYIDSDKDGIFDTGEKNLLTDSAGNYKFTGLASGTHRVREVVNSGWRAHDAIGGLLRRRRHRRVGRHVEELRQHAEGPDQRHGLQRFEW